MQLDQERELEGEIIYLNKDSKRGLFRQTSGQELWFDIAEDVDAYSIYALFGKRSTTITGSAIPTASACALELSKQINRAQSLRRNGSTDRVARNRQSAKRVFSVLLLATLLSAKLYAQNFVGVSYDSSAEVMKLTSAGAVLSTGEVLLSFPDQGPDGARYAVAGPYSLTGQYVYLLLDHRARAGFLDANSGVSFVVDAPTSVELTDSRGAKRTWLRYRSTNALTGVFAVLERK
jgi:hypothetical protein